MKRKKFWYAIRRFLFVYCSFFILCGFVVTVSFFLFFQFIEMTEEQAMAALCIPQDEQEKYKSLLRDCEEIQL